jgi:hypothetical protein
MNTVEGEGIRIVTLFNVHRDTRHVERLWSWFVVCIECMLIVPSVSTYDTWWYTTHVCVHVVCMKVCEGNVP